jgi:hypothetical protein
MVKTSWHRGITAPRGELEPQPVELLETVTERKTA